MHRKRSLSMPTACNDKTKHANNAGNNESFSTFNDYLSKKINRVGIQFFPTPKQVEILDRQYDLSAAEKTTIGGAMKISPRAKI